ncbi:MAG: signal recognition particle protein [Actinomycetota bacterium]|nr:signal recognition particle protein [Actinomycetota bacterium]
MFESLSERFDGIFKRIRSRGVLTEQDVNDVMREIRRALVGADVHRQVAKDFTARVGERAVGEEVSKALNPSQQIIKIVHEELIATLGGETLAITFAPKPPTVVLLAGLQGSGKTTNAGKLARWFRGQGRNPLLIGADLQRPAAVEQLRTLGKQVGVPVFSEPTDPVEVAKAGLRHAIETGRDVVICDTAGRLAIDAELMEQVRQIEQAIEPHYTFLVVDAMTGQDAVTVAKNFHEALELDGVIMTKLDGDARGGAALSVKEVVGRPIAFASTGEKLEDFEQFHPDRLAGRILGMGDVLTLIEKAEEAYDQQEAEEAAAKLLEGQFTLDDFLEQMQQLKKMGPLTNLIGMLPGVPKEVKDAEIDDRQVARIEAMIRSMTLEERAEPDLIDQSRRHRIANGSGTRPNEVSQLVKQFKDVQRLMKQAGGMGSKKVGGRSKRKKKKGSKGGRTSPPKSLTLPTEAAQEKPKGGLRLPGL